MATWPVGREIRYYSAICGAPLLLYLTYPLQQQLQKRIKLYKLQFTEYHKQARNHSMTGNDKSQTATGDMDDTYEHENDAENQSHTIFPPFILLTFAFLNVIFALMHLTFVIIFSNPKKMDITLSDYSCTNIATVIHISYLFSLHFYFLFMLYRIRIIFIEPESIKLNSKLYYICLVLIHVVLIYKIAWHRIVVEGVWNDKISFCTMTKETKQLVPRYRTISYISDTFVITLFSVIFIYKLFSLTRQNEKINSLIKRTLLLGILSSVTSLFLSIGMLIGIPMVFFVVFDEIINCFSVVMSYKMQSPYCCYTKSKKSENKENDDDSSEQYIKPSDEIVMEEIFRSNEYGNEEKYNANYVKSQTTKPHLHT